MILHLDNCNDLNYNIGLKSASYKSTTQFHPKNGAALSKVKITTKDTLSVNLITIDIFLKYRYHIHVLKSSNNCVTHDANCVLRQKLVFDCTLQISEKGEENISCLCCRFPIYVSNKIKKLVSDLKSNNNTKHLQSQVTDVLLIIQECEEKFK